MLKDIYADFGFTEVKVKFSDRPEVRGGSDETWDKAEAALKEATKASGIAYSDNKGEGAFYGPKLEFVLRDAIGRDWQCGTFQVDYVIPDRLEAEYVAAGGGKERPVMLHRAVIGSFERFIGILIEQYAGKFPLWLAPVQVAVVTITSDADGYASEVDQKLKDAGVRTALDISNEKINYKVREYSMQKVPMIAVVGKTEQENGTVAVRFFGSDDQKIMKLEEIIAMVEAENKKYFG